MPKIQLLPQEEILKIAAGEVVRRPASVVKELVENSVDAGSKNIVVKIEKAGSRLISIEDDGCGMEREDALLSVHPHATSKITSLQDLAKVSTFGFRGEALASIAAVSELEVSTLASGAGVGTRLLFRAGKKEVVEDVSRSCGTTINVVDLFGSIPVRKKFLKSSETEESAIRQAFVGLALANPGVTFKLFFDGRLAFNAVSTTDLKERFAQLFDYNLAQNMLPVDLEKLGVRVSGLTSNLQVTRYSRNNILLFVNNRIFKDSKLASAICSGYDGALPNQKFPATCLFLEMDQQLVDVNIHPAKEEVCFFQHGKVLSVVKEAIHQALMNQAEIKNQSASVAPATSWVFDEEDGCSTQLAAKKTDEADFCFSQRVGSGGGVTRMDTPFFGEDHSFFSGKFFGLDAFEPLSGQQLNKAVSIPKSAMPQQQVVPPAQKNYKIIGQLFSTYILYQQGEELVIMDQHAASERILYEGMKDRFENLPSAKLLFPVVVNLKSVELVSKIIDNFEVFLRFGICFEQFGKTELSVNALPPGFENNDLMDMFLEFAEKLEVGLDSSGVRKKAFEHLHSHLACKTAIKAGDVLSPEAMSSLLENLLEVDNNYQCIHGRPTTFKFTKPEVEKWFKRPSSKKKVEENS